MAKHETFTALMNAGMAWCAIVGVLLFFTVESNRFLVGGVTSFGFWSIIVIYFYWDYKKSHKKSEPSIPHISVSYPPLTPETVEPTKPKQPSNKTWIFIKNLIFITLGTIESAYFLSLILLWEVVTIPVGDVNIPILTYQNGFLLATVVIGFYLAVMIGSRLRHPKKAFFE